MKIISVIILTYNNLTFLYEALNSVFMQDYPSIELILSDDNSLNFNTSEINNYIKKNNKGNLYNVIIRQNPKNVGTVRNLNEALRCASGDYIVPLAGDDVFYQHNVLSSFAQSFESLPADEMLITTQVKNYDILLKTCLGDALSRKQIQLLSDSFEVLYAHLSLSCFIPAGGTAYRRTLFEEYGLFDERYTLVEDWPFALKMTRLGVRFHYADFISVMHRDGGVSHNGVYLPSQKQYQTDLINVMNNEILPNRDFIPNIYRKKIWANCKDKATIYTIRYRFNTFTLGKKTLFILQNNLLIPALFRGIKRRLK